MSIPERVVWNDKFHTVTSIGYDVIGNSYGNSTLKSLVLPKKLKIIGANAFRYCSGLTEVKLPETLNIIGSEAFRGCSGLTSIDIPNSVTTIGDGAFNGCSKLNSFILEDGNNEISIGADILQNTAIANIYIGRNLTGCIGSDVSTVTYGNAVTTISDNAFNGAANLSTLNLGSSIETIGENAFNGCALAELVLPPHVKTIGNNAFAGNSIKNIAIGSEVTEIGEKAFDGANQLNGVSITALTPPNANNNTFSYYDCPLYVTPECVEAYYNFTRCWYRFSGHDLILADKVTIRAASGNVANITLKPGETMKFSATVTPADASLPYIFWRSTNPAFATVDQEGNVTLVDNGGVSAQADDEEAETHTCEIIAETLYADVMASITVMDEAAGVEDIVADGSDAEIARPNDIYTLQGVCLKRDASQSDIDALTPGLYIIAGKKVIVK